MSDNFLIFIPADPEFVPAAESRKHALKYLRDRFPHAEELGEELYAKATFIDCGGNLESIRCPQCHSIVDLEWWRDHLVDVGHRFAELPCCPDTQDLNNLIYDWPCGFARYELYMRNAGRDAEDHEIKFLEAELNTSLRLVRSHI